MTKATKLYSGFTMDYSADRMAAVAEDGTIFTRVKGRTRYGYSWSKWRPTSAIPEGMREMEANSACINHRAYFKDGKPNVRLPCAP